MEMTQYQRDFVRTADSVRNTHKGEMSCDGLECEHCPIRKLCVSIRVGKRTLYVEDVIKAVSEWAKEHPIMTMADKYKEVFGVEPKKNNGDYVCPHSIGFINVACHQKQCEDCIEGFWGSEYKPPKTDKEGVSE